MSTVTLILTSLLTLTMVVLIAPNILALNRGKTLRNIALWLAIALALALAYRTVGPGRMAPVATEQGVVPGEVTTPNIGEPSGEAVIDSDGYTPPRE